MFFTVIFCYSMSLQIRAFRTANADGGNENSRAPVDGGPSNSANAPRGTPEV